MSFFVIDKLPIFLTREKYDELLKETPRDKIQSLRELNIFSDKAREEKDKMVYDLLLKKYQKDKDEFLIKWFSFDIRDSEAKFNVWDLLYDYSIYYGYSYLTDFREFPDKIISDYEGESMLFPMGKAFYFTHFVKPNKWWWKLRYKMNGRKIEILIDVEKVKIIKGNLTEFYIQFTDSVIRLDKNVNICL